MLQISFNFSPDIINKHDRFSEILSEKGLKFVPCDESDLVPLNLSLVLLPVEFDSISEKQGHKKNALVACSINRIKIILILLAEVIKIYV